MSVEMYTDPVTMGFVLVNKRTKEKYTYDARRASIEHYMFKTGKLLPTRKIIGWTRNNYPIEEIVNDFPEWKTIDYFKPPDRAPKWVKEAVKNYLRTREKEIIKENRV